jgi:predicted transcriptional regulator
MARPKSRTLTDVELEIMRILWACGEATVPDLAQTLAKAGRPLAQPSIRTMLSILQRKGYVVRRAAAGRGFAYRALVSQDQTQQHFVRTVVERVFGGSPLALVSTLLRDDAISAKDLAKVQRMIRDKGKGERR